MCLATDVIVTVAVCCSSKFMKILCLVEGGIYGHEHSTFDQILCIPVISYFLFVSLFTEHKFMIRNELAVLTSWYKHSSRKYFELQKK